MAEEKVLKINPNVADEKALQQLPGIGPSLAKKIVDSRPYSKLDDLEKVQGIGKSVLGRIAQSLVFEETEDYMDIAAEGEIEEIEMPVEQLSAVEVEPELISPDGQRAENLRLSKPTVDKLHETEAITDQDIEKKIEQPPRAKEVKKTRLVRAFTRTETIWLVAAVGILALILSVSLNLIILAGINGTLDFNQLEGLKQLESDTNLLEENLSNLTSSLNAFDQRLTPLEGLTGRMTVVEDLTETLRADVSDALASVEIMQSDLERLSNETARLSGRVDRFDKFLDELHRVLTEIFAEPSSETQPES